ncbi:hypothetical protein Bpfe_001764 [Biomphalaria pfeifferi]|uniref:C3H1-type domain-containing protein n=1 Tax=Biomphalaria pfeifferi TaxID=112525 RepID=A0AAD8C9D0_BIOPF|nr:hypothetical protein Bpfe_001764 [Biomphalaria pfeifferi]
MASLVADYSDSDSESEEANAIFKSEADQEEIKVKEEHQCVSEQKPVNFFDAEECESDEESQVTVKKEPVDKVPNLVSTKKLPSLIEAVNSRIGTSVFKNPFQEAEQAKNQILERHVKLTQAAPRKPAHQPVCWKFKKGKCHMGKNCRFFHDPEIRTIPDSDHSPTDTQNSTSHTISVYHPSAFALSDSKRSAVEEEDDDSYMGSMKKKKRYGVTDNMLPPKKALESLQRQREKERPWTLTNANSQ